MRKIRAFTLVELLVVLAIVGILMTFAYPSYRDYILRGARVDARIGIQGMAARMEKHYAIRNSYTAMSPVLSPEGYYNISGVTGIVSESSCEAATSDSSATFSYTITARPVSSGRQGDDEDCACLLLTSTGVKGAIDSDGNSADCW